VTVVPTKWVPRWAKPNVEAEYTPLVTDPLTGMVDEPQHVTCRCTKCGALWKQDCASGAARTHIQHFAQEHNKCWKESP